MQKIIIFGANSYLAENLQNFFHDIQITSLPYKNWRDYTSLLQKAEWVINFAISPNFSERDMLENEILDIQIAHAIKHAQTKFIFMSSRKVYGSSKECITYKETDDLLGKDFYAKNKIKTEKSLTTILGNRLTILRISNVVGHPIVKENYKTFMGWITDSFIKTGKLDVTQSSTIIKDFITRDFLHAVIQKIIQANVTGIYNVSSNLPITLKELLCKIVGEENIFFLNEENIYDQFLLDNSKLSKAIDISMKKADMFNILLQNRQKLIELSKSN